MRKRLTPEQFISWIEKDHWTKAEAFYLLQGEEPDQGNVENVDRWLMDDEPEWQVPVKAEPWYWIHAALNVKQDIDYFWKACYPRAAPTSLDVVFTPDQEHSRDYRHLADVLVRNTPSPMQELVEFVTLNKADQRQLLKKVNQHLGLNVSRYEELLDVMVNPMDFFTCDDVQGYHNNKDIKRWVRWIENNPELAGWIQQQAQPKQVTDSENAPQSNLVTEALKPSAEALKRRANRKDRLLLAREFLRIHSTGKIGDYELFFQKWWEANPLPGKEQGYAWKDQHSQTRSVRRRTLQNDLSTVRNR